MFSGNNQTAVAKGYNAHYTFLGGIAQKEIRNFSQAGGVFEFASKNEDDNLKQAIYTTEKYRSANMSYILDGTIDDVTIAEEIHKLVNGSSIYTISRIDSKPFAMSSFTGKDNPSEYTVCIYKSIVLAPQLHHEPFPILLADSPITFARIKEPHFDLVCGPDGRDNTVYPQDDLKVSVDDIRKSLKEVLKQLRTNTKDSKGLGKSSIFSKE